MTAALEIAMTYAAIRIQAKPRIVLMLLATVALVAAHAEEPSQALVLAAHLNAAGGTDLTSGKYAAALL